MHYLQSRLLLALPEYVNKWYNSLVTCDLSVLVFSARRMTFVFLCPTVTIILQPMHDKVALGNLEHGKVCSV